MLTIGEFSRLGRITPRMLRHYDALGLLHPEAVGENGYRYYRQEQLSDLVRIQWLSGYGFSLHEIGSLLDMDDRQLLPLLQQRRLALYRELDGRPSAGSWSREGTSFAVWRRTSSAWKEFQLWKQRTVLF